MARSTTHGNQQTFRQWLVSQLKMSRWSSIRGETQTELAKRLGVQEDVLAQAVAEREQGIKEKAPRHILELCRVKVYIPLELNADWAECCKILGVHEAALLRSLMNHYLAHPTPTPAMRARGWMYRGKKYKALYQSRITVNCRVSRGAQIALDHHARHQGLSRSKILKGLMLDMLEGRLTRFKIVMPSEMWGDPKRYLEPELFT